MSRIDHFKQQPVNMQFWDYYILCHLKPDIAIALQRMEFWDGTKEDANAHAEDINEVLEQSGQQATQDTSNWIYKAQDALLWELMGIVGERKLPNVLSFLEKDLQYLEVRNNPNNGWDRKKQYSFQASRIQEHINYLGYIVSYFALPMRRLTPVFYAIEALTREGIHIDTLNVEMVLAKIESWQAEDAKIPHFLKAEVEKFLRSRSTPDVAPFRDFAEWIAQKRGMQPAETRNAFRKNAESIPQNRGSNSIRHNNKTQSIRDKHSSSKPAPTPESGNDTDAQAETTTTGINLEDTLSLPVLTPEVEKLAIDCALILGLQPDKKMQRLIAEYVELPVEEVARETLDFVRSTPGTYMSLALFRNSLKHKKDHLFDGKEEKTSRSVRPTEGKKVAVYGANVHTIPTDEEVDRVNTTHFANLETNSPKLIEGSWTVFARNPQKYQKYLGMLPKDQHLPIPEAYHHLMPSQEGI